MRHPIDALLEEHVSILAQVEKLRQALEALRQRGEAALPEALPAFRAAVAMMGTQLHRHARKEDEALFPALEAVWGRQEGMPTAVMRMEHSKIHHWASEFRETLALLEAQHPDIVKRTAELQASVSGDPDLESLLRLGDEITQLLALHFGKEEDILFPMAREILSPAALEEIARKMDDLSSRASPPS
jgi:iron-sulfur cluster repair protein YtfE (RIC family)